jgi:hypothetical protein
MKRRESILLLGGIAMAEKFAAASSSVRLRLTFDEAKRILSAVLVNDLSRPIAVVTGDLQPCLLTLTGSPGTATPSDSRAIRKYDNTVYRSSFREVPPNGSLLLAAGRFSRGERLEWSLSWGPFRFENLVAGAWKAAAVFDSSADEWFDPESQSIRPAKNAWRGQVQSDTVTIHLPQ